MEKQRKKRMHWGALFGIAFLLAASIFLFSMESSRAKAICFSLILLALFMTLIYFQLRFYHEGDRSHVRHTITFPATEIIKAPSQLKSPYHKAVWENMELTRRLMQHKEEEYSRNSRIHEEKALGFNSEEEILFVSNRSFLFFWPVAVFAFIFLVVAAFPFKELPTAYSFGCFIAGLSGLLLLTAAKSHTRYYLTNFRVLIKRQLPWSKPRWAALRYPSISMLSRKRRFACDELTLGSREKTLFLRGLAPHKLKTVLDILSKKLPPESKGNEPKARSASY
jgi:hypothetical protein